MLVVCQRNKNNITVATRAGKELLLFLSMFFLISSNPREIVPQNIILSRVFTCPARDIYR